MNEELQKAITELFQTVLSAKDFLAGELPEYIEQLLMWKAAYSFIHFCIAVVLVLFALVVVKKLAPKIKEVYSNHSLDESAIVSLITIIPIIFYGLVIGFFIDFDWLQIWLAPKVWLVEYAAEMVK